MCLTISYSTIPKLSFVFSYRYTHQRLAIVSFSHSLNITSLFSKNTCYHTMHFGSTSQAQQQNFPFTLHWTCFHFRFDLAAGLLKTCFIPPPLVMWVLRFWAVSAIQGESNWVVSWSTKWVYLVRPDRPKFLTWKNKWFNTVEIILFYAVLFLSRERSACMLHVYQITACPIYFL